MIVCNHEIVVHVYTQLNKLIIDVSQLRQFFAHLSMCSGINLTNIRPQWYDIIYAYDNAIKSTQEIDSVSYEISPKNAEYDNIKDD